MVVVGSAVILVGLLLILAGLAMAWGEYKQGRSLGGTEFVQALRDLVVAIAGKRGSLILLTFGTLLVFLGGVIAGVGGLTS